MRKVFIIVAVILLCVILAFWAIRLSIRETIYTAKHSGNIYTSIKQDPRYPYVGIWKTDSTVNFGIIIEQASDDKYSVSFFGPGGRFKPGTWMPTTTIIDDSTYRIVDKDVIEINKGFGFTRYYRMSNVEQRENELR